MYAASLASGYSAGYGLQVKNVGLCSGTWDYEQGKAGVIEMSTIGTWDPELAEGLKLVMNERCGVDHLQSTLGN